ncbi:hypothetical protein [Patulibacter defluvii]|uniref:hypothetical protein n=1 Tax=Patulibacter defluvii TaxID=3095358 RepID=UPI002A75684F|nr:hypothetical protein [Patulibacter sp. DM4]
MSGDPTRLQASIVHPDGSSTRWSRDEIDEGMVPGGLTLTTSMPGGFKSAGGRLVRKLSRKDREGPFDEITLTGPGTVGPGRTVAWQGRLDSMARTSEGGGAAAPQAIGHCAILDDSKSFTGTIVDRTLERWTQPAIERRQAVMASYKALDGQTGWHASLGPMLAVTCPGYPWTTNAGRCYVMVAYDAGPGMSAAKVTFKLARLNAAVAVGDPFVFYAAAGDTAILSSGYDIRTDLNTLANGTSTSLVGTKPRRYWEFASYYPTAPAGSNDSGEYGFYVYNLAVHGPHGLPERTGAGLYPDGSPITGYLASDILAWALPQAAPGLRFTTGAAGTIRPTDFPIPHLVFDQPSNGADIVNAVNGYHQWEYAVWEDRTFHFHPVGARATTWRMRIGERFHLSPEGDKSTNIYTGVVVSFTGLDGLRHTVGPPGTAVEFTDPSLADTNPGNPAVANNTPRIKDFQLSDPTSTAAAAAIGRAWLIDQSRASRTGTATATGMVTDDNGNEHPPWAIRAGDRLEVLDRPDDPPRTIIETSYDHATRTIQLTLDNTAPRLDAIVQRFGSSLVGVI